MKYFVSTTPGPMPITPEQLDASLEWLDGKLDDGTFDCVYGFLEGGGFGVAWKLVPGGIAFTRVSSQDPVLRSFWSGVVWKRVG